MNQSDLPRLIARLNDAWLSQDYTALSQCYHPDAVLLPPDAGAPIIGREAVISTYRDFHALVTLRKFEVTEQIFFPYPSTTLSTTMCHMRFTIAYELNALSMQESGMDIYTIVDDQVTGPVIAWRAQITL